MAFSPSRGLLYTDPPADESDRRTRADADVASADESEIVTPSADEPESATDQAPTAADD